MKDEKRYRIVRKMLIGMAALSLSVAITVPYLHNRPAYERQETEESFAEDYIQSLIRKEQETEGGTEGDEGKKEDTIKSAYEVADGREIAYGVTEVTEGGREDDSANVSYPDYEDDRYYVGRDGTMFTPEYAVGSIQCVLEYPACQIRRGVYIGTWEEIQTDLDIWMATAARPDYVPGETHYAIYGHNHTAQNLSFNNLKEAKTGDEFALICDTGAYLYEVTELLVMSREDVTRVLVDDMNLPAEQCYIITCGRDNFIVNGESTRYRDFVVKGELKEKMSVTEYAEREK